MNTSTRSASTKEELIGSIRAPERHTCNDCGKPAVLRPRSNSKGRWYWRRELKCEWCRNKKYTKSEVPYIYAVWLSRERLLKIGYSTQAKVRCVISAETKYVKRFGHKPKERAQLIWTLDNADMIDEAFFQAAIQLRGCTAAWDTSTRLSEWVTVPDWSSKSYLVDLLNNLDGVRKLVDIREE